MSNEIAEAIGHEVYKIYFFIYINNINNIYISFIYRSFITSDWGKIGCGSDQDLSMVDGDSTEE